MDTNNDVNSVSFSPTNSQLLISASDDNTVQQWDINGHQIGPTYEGNTSCCFLLRWDSFCFMDVTTWSIQTEGVINEVSYWDSTRTHKDPLIVNGSKVWVSQTHGWDFEGPSSRPILLPNSSLVKPHIPYVDFVISTERGCFGQSGIKDMVTGREVFQLPRKYAEPTVKQWDGQYLIAGYDSGEVLILHFNQVSLGSIADNW
jgi:WD40 repeat protein